MGFLSSLRLRRIAPELVLSPHYKSTRGIRNCLPPKNLWANISPTLRVAEKMSARLNSPLERVNSAYRSPAYNARIRGRASKSQHMQNCIKA